MAAKDNLKDLLQERFTGHEVDVDPGLWQAISGQLAATAPAQDGLSDLLKERFQDHELDVDPGVWNSISSQLGQGAAAGAAGGSGLGGWLAAGIAATVITGGVLFWALSPGTPEPPTTASTPTDAPRTAVEATTPEAKAPAAGTAEGTAAIAALPTASTAPPQPAPVENPAQRAGTPPPGSETLPAPASPGPAAPAQGDQPEGAHIAEVNMIIDRLIQQTMAAPVIAQTESVPEAGLVQGQEPELLPEVNTDALEAGTDAPAPAPVVWIPNAFSPGMRDGVNDELEVKAEGLSDLQVRIYSLDSRLVFRAGDLHPWDGRDLSGQPCQQGYYFYAIEGLDAGGKPFTKGQTIYLFR